MSDTEQAAAPAESVPERRSAPARPPVRTYPPGPAEPVLSGKLPNGLDFDADAQGINREFVTGQYDKNGYTDIDHFAWMRQCAEGGYIGTCRRCGAYLFPRRPIEHNGVFDYEGYCRRPAESTFDALTGVRMTSGCGWEFCAPRGKVMLSSSSRSARRAALSKLGRGVSNASPARDEPPF